jgi:hypothetical protein
MKRFGCHLLFLLILTGVTLVMSGCATTDEAENASARPWNSPQGWETGGLPSSMNEGR